MCRIPFLILAMLLVFAACTPRVKENTTSPVRVHPKHMATLPDRALPVTDTSVYLFNKKIYRIDLHLFRPGVADDCRPNATLTFSKRGKMLFRDSLYCRFARLSLEDFNHDKVRDLLIYYNAEGKWHNVPTYHLYVINKKHHQVRIKRVEDFEFIPSPAYDSLTNIVSGAFPRGDQEMCTFHRVGKKGRLFNLGNSFTGKILQDSVQWNYAIAQIVGRWKMVKGE